jgi:hypothetical protein
MDRLTIVLAAGLLLVPVSECGARLHAFWGTPEKDGYTQMATYPGHRCPDQYIPVAISTGIVGECQASHKPVQLQIWDRLFLSFNTASLEGEAVDSAQVKVVVHYKAAANWETNLLTDFVAACISERLAVGDTSCYACADTIIPYGALPEAGDTLTIVMRPTWVNCSGATEIVMKAEREADACAATGNNVIKLRTTEYSGTASDPRLYVWTSDKEGTSHKEDLEPDSEIENEGAESPDSSRVECAPDAAVLGRILSLYR